MQEFMVQDDGSLSAKHNGINCNHLDSSTVASTSSVDKAPANMFSVSFILTLSTPTSPQPNLRTCLKNLLFLNIAHMHILLGASFCYTLQQAQ